eukprot:scaffold12086_cov67-Phaeocystis_antarctica.AAC.12
METSRMQSMIDCCERAGREGRARRPARRDAVCLTSSFPADRRYKVLQPGEAEPGVCAPRQSFQAAR